MTFSKSTYSRLVLAAILLFVAVHPSSAQIAKMYRDTTFGLPNAENLFKPASVDESVLYRLDEARTVKQMDATADGAHWYVVDEFANWQYITIDGHPFADRYHEIAGTGTRLSPNGDYLIWSGMMHAVTEKGFDSTTVYVHKDTSLVAHYVSDNPEVEFSHSGKHWAETLPYAYYLQKGDRDLVIVDGQVVSKGNIYPHQFSFSHDEQHWAYRTTENFAERYVTDRTPTPVLLYNGNIPTGQSTYDPTIWRYTPDVRANPKRLEGRDYDFLWEHVAKLNRTAYSSLAADTSRMYINFNNRNQSLYRWISQVLIDNSGDHIAYFAADPKMKLPSTNERPAVIVQDGKIYAGPYPGVRLLFMSPSGKHLAYSLAAGVQKFYLDKKVLAKTSGITDAAWSPDESKLAFVAAGTHGKFFVVANGKRSALFEQIGRISWTPDGKTVEFVGIRNGQVVHVQQRI